MSTSRVSRLVCPGHRRSAESSPGDGPEVTGWVYPPLYRPARLSGGRRGWLAGFRRASPAPPIPGAAIAARPGMTENAMRATSLHERRAARVPRPALVRAAQWAGRPQCPRFAALPGRAGPASGSRRPALPKARSRRRSGGTTAPRNPPRSHRRKYRRSPPPRTGTPRGRAGHPRDDGPLAGAAPGGGPGGSLRRRCS
jgi:hypothetical protein